MHKRHPYQYVLFSYSILTNLIKDFILLAIMLIFLAILQPMQKFNLNSEEAGNTPTDGKTSGFPSPAADYLAVGIDLNALLVEHPSSHFKAWLKDGSKSYLVIVDRALGLKDGCRVVAWENQQWYLKIYRMIKKEAWLYPVGKNEQLPIKINEDEPYTVLGRVSKLIWMNP
jgi:DNA polymerase V